MKTLLIAAVLCGVSGLTAEAGHNNVAKRRDRNTSSSRGHRHDGCCDYWGFNDFHCCQWQCYPYCYKSCNHCPCYHGYSWGCCGGYSNTCCGQNYCCGDSHDKVGPAPAEGKEPPKEEAAAPMNPMPETVGAPVTGETPPAPPQ